MDYDIFRRVQRPDPAQMPNKFYSPEDFDFRLKPGCAAADAGCVLPNVNDGFTGKAPDLGALELDTPLPSYGPPTGAK